jgi:putative nucleotidyltransferase with HDIG domain
MIKKIKVEELKPGMFIHDLNCGWMNHNFLFNGIKVKNEKTIKRIINHGIREVYIDTAKGLDVVDAPSEAEVKRQMQTRMYRVVQSKTEMANPFSMENEFAKAITIKNEAKEIVRNVMEDVRLGKQIEMEKVHHVVTKIVDSIFRNKDALISLSRIKQTDEYTFLHSVSVCVLMVSFCRALNIERDVINDIGVGALLHDIGKMKVPREILNKPGKLSENEFEKIKEHVIHSRMILSQTPGITPIAALIAFQHHERYDGTGYPKGLKGEAISYYGQMASIVDVYDALTPDRCYHKGMEPTEALGKIYEWSQCHFNANLVQKYIECIGIYPPGTWVSLKNGLLGVVVESGKENLLYPVIRVVYDIKRGCFIEPRVIDLSQSADGRDGNKIVSYESPKQWNINPFEFLQPF